MWIIVFVLVRRGARVEVAGVDVGAVVEVAATAVVPLPPAAVAFAVSVAVAAAAAITTASSSNTFSISLPRYNMLTAAETAEHCKRNHKSRHGLLPRSRCKAHTALKSCTDGRQIWVARFHRRDDATIGFFVSNKGFELVLRHA